MILVNFFTAFFAIFISPQIILYYKYDDVKYSFVLIYGLIISFSVSWVLSLVTFFFHIEDIFLYVLFIVVMIYSLIYMYKHKSTRNYKEYIIWAIVFVLMIPLLLHVGDGFTSCDAINSWNRWALELYRNEYHPIIAAYPILLPSVWSLIYKVQGTGEIWWTAQITLFSIPFFILAILFTLYKENKDNAFLFMIIFMYPYLVWLNTINGYMDMPVMLMGTLSLITLYAAEINKGKRDFEYYIIAALLLAGIASIIKQAGLIFLIFNYVYLLVHLKDFSNKKRVLLYSFLALLYFISFLLFYYQYQASATGNLNHLKNLSGERAFEGKNINQIIDYLSHEFFSYPPRIPWLVTILEPLGLAKYAYITVTPLLIAIGLLLFFIKKLRNYRSISFISAIFFLIGTGIWIKFFSYDSRNSYWVKSFFIIFLSINASYLFTKYFPKITLKDPIFNLFSFSGRFYFQKIIPKYIFFAIVILIMVYLYILGDCFAYKKQKQSQSTIGSVLNAKAMSKLLENKNECLVIYTNGHYDQYNYYAKDVFDKIFRLGPVRNVPALCEHSCPDGRYFIFITSRIPEDKEAWNKVLELEQNSKLKFIKKTKGTIIYFAPPKTKRMKK